MSRGDGAAGKVFCAPQRRAPIEVLQLAARGHRHRVRILACCQQEDPAILKVTDGLRGGALGGDQ